MEHRHSSFLQKAYRTVVKGGKFAAAISAISIILAFIMRSLYQTLRWQSHNLPATDPLLLYIYHAVTFVLCILFVYGSYKYITSFKNKNRETFLPKFQIRVCCAVVGLVVGLAILSFVITRIARWDLSNFVFFIFVICIPAASIYCFVAAPSVLDPDKQSGKFQGRLWAVLACAIALLFVFGACYRVYDAVCVETKTYDILLHDDQMYAVVSMQDGDYIVQKCKIDEQANTLVILNDKRMKIDGTNVELTRQYFDEVEIKPSNSA